MEWCQVFAVSLLYVPQNKQKSCCKIIFHLFFIYQLITPFFRKQEKKLRIGIEYIQNLHLEFESSYQTIDLDALRSHLSDFLTANRRDHKNKMPVTFPKKILLKIFCDEEGTHFFNVYLSLYLIPSSFTTDIDSNYGKQFF